MDNMTVYSSVSGYVFWSNHQW